MVLFFYWNIHFVNILHMIPWNEHFWLKKYKLIADSPRFFILSQYDEKTGAVQFCFFHTSACCNTLISKSAGTKAIEYGGSQ